MPKRLTEDEVARYRREGYLSPLTMFDKYESSKFRQKLESFEASQGGPITGDMRSKSHLIFKWVDDLMRDDRILDPVEDLIGGDILCWHTFFWIKEPATESYVSWHQDLNYWGLDTDQLVTGTVTGNKTCSPEARRSLWTLTPLRQWPCRSRPGKRPSTMVDWLILRSQIGRRTVALDFRSTTCRPIPAKLSATGTALLWFAVMTPMGISLPLHDPSETSTPCPSDSTRKPLTRAVTSFSRERKRYVTPSKAPEFRSHISECSEID